LDLLNNKDDDKEYLFWKDTVDDTDIKKDKISDQHLVEIIIFAFFLENVDKENNNQSLFHQSSFFETDKDTAKMLNTRRNETGNPNQNILINDNDNNDCNSRNIEARTSTK